MCIKLNLQETVKAFHIEARARCLQGARVNIWKSAFTPAVLYVFRRGALCSEWTGFPLQWNLQIDETSLNVALKLHFLSGYDKRRSSFLQRVGVQSPQTLWWHSWSRPGAFGFPLKINAALAELQAANACRSWKWSGLQAKSRGLCERPSSAAAASGAASPLSPLITQHSASAAYIQFHTAAKKTIFGWVIRYRARSNQHAASRLITGRRGSLTIFFFSVCWTWIIKQTGTRIFREALMKVIFDETRRVKTDKSE